MLETILLATLAPTQPFAGWPDSAPVETVSQESHLRNVRQLTFGGQNAEAYWSPDGERIVWQSTQPGFPDEQIFVMDADGGDKTLVSTGKGRCTCGYFSPNGEWIYFSSTHSTAPGAQPKVDMSRGYVWRVNPHFDLYRAHPDGTGLEPVVTGWGYFAETTIAPDGSFMTFTSDVQGDLDIYRSDLDGTNRRKLVSRYGYDGGPFVSWDSSKIAYRSSPDFQTVDAAQDYMQLLARHLVQPSHLEIWIMDADGSNKRQVTWLGGANFAPFVHPDGERVIFSSNFQDPRGREFDLFIVNIDGSKLERITYSGEFDGFPMFNREGTKLLFASNRNGGRPGETNVFVADWVE